MSAATNPRPLPAIAGALREWLARGGDNQHYFILLDELDAAILQQSLERSAEQVRLRVLDDLEPEAEMPPLHELRSFGSRPYFGHTMHTLTCECGREFCDIFESKARAEFDIHLAKSAPAVYVPQPAHGKTSDTAPAKIKHERLSNIHSPTGSRIRCSCGAIMTAPSWEGVYADFRAHVAQEAAK